MFAGSFLGGERGLTAPGQTFADYDATADGMRFVMIPVTREVQTARRATVRVMTTWFDKLRAAVGE